MGILSKLIRKITRPVRTKRNGVIGERKVINKLNPLFFEKVNHRQINNLIIVDEHNKSHQIDHIEIRQNGIFCIETKNYIGWIFGDDLVKKWTQVLYNGEKYQFVNPLKQNKSHCYHISKVLNNKYIINSIVVMVNNNADKIKCSNVINLNYLTEYLREFNNGVSLSNEEMDEIYNKLLEINSKMTNKEHIQNIIKTKNEIAQNICPRCGGRLVLRNGKNGVFYGCSNFPKCRFTKNITISN